MRKSALIVAIIAKSTYVASILLKPVKTTAEDLPMIIFAQDLAAHYEEEEHPMTTTESYHIAAMRLHLQELRRIAQTLEPANEAEAEARDELAHELWHTAVLVDDIETSFERL